MPIATFSLVALDCPDPQALAGFYSAITGWPIADDDAEWVVLRNDAGATLAFQLATDHVAPVWPSSEHPQQAHIDFDVPDLVAAETAVLALGARKADVQPGTTFTVFLDPAGHPFCLVLARPGPVHAAPTTVTEAVAYLHAEGYIDEVDLEGTSVTCARTQMTIALENVIVDHTFRFEGDSDPGDEAIVLGLRYPDTDVRATLVSAFGHGADPATAEFFRRLHDA